jgi:Ca-activated chloride channel homolog
VGVVVYNTESCTIEAVDAKTGKRLWHKWLGDPLMSQPAIAKGRVYMAYPGESGHHYLICLDLKNGKPYWKSQIAGDIISAPVVHDGSVYLATLDGTVYRYGASDGKKLWNVAKNATSAPWVVGQDVYASIRETQVAGKILKPGAPQPVAAAGGAGGGKVAHYEAYARIDVKGGQTRQQDIARRAAPYLSAVANSGRGYAKKAQAADASVGFSSAPATAKIAQAQTNLGANQVSEVWAYQGSRPVVVNGRNYSAQNETMQCLDAATGKPLWKYSVAEDKESARTLTPPSLAGDKLYFGSSRGELFCVRQSDGKLLWKVSVGAPVLFPPAVVGGRVYVGTQEGSLICLNTGDQTADGWPMWGGSAAHNGPTDKATLAKATAKP